MVAKVCHSYLQEDVFPSSMDQRRTEETFLTPRMNAWRSAVRLMKRRISLLQAQLIDLPGMKHPLCAGKGQRREGVGGPWSGGISTAEVSAVC